MEYRVALSHADVQTVVTDNSLGFNENGLVGFSFAVGQRNVTQMVVLFSLWRMRLHTRSRSENTVTFPLPEVVF